MAKKDKVVKRNDGVNGIYSKETSRKKYRDNRGIS